MTSVYIVQHVHCINDDEEDVKMIGVYATELLAQAAVEHLRFQPGFCDTPDGFCIDQYELNKDHWIEGYVIIDSSGCEDTDESGS